MEKIKQCKKYNYKIYIKYDKFNEPYYSIEDYSNTYIKENLSFRLPFNYVENKAKKLYTEEKETPTIPF